MRMNVVKEFIETERDYIADIHILLNVLALSLSLSLSPSLSFSLSLSDAHTLLSFFSFFFSQRLLFHSMFSVPLSLGSFRCL